MLRGSLEDRDRRKRRDGEPGIRRGPAAAGARDRRRPCCSTSSAPATPRSAICRNIDSTRMRIDASLVRPNAFGARSPILRSIVAMAQEIGMDVISEGAETESDAVELAQIGCQFAQGAAFGQPMSAAAARKLMGARRPGCGPRAERLVKAGDNRAVRLPKRRPTRANLTDDEVHARVSRRDPGPAAGVGGRGQARQIAQAGAGMGGPLALQRGEDPLLLRQ